MKATSASVTAIGASARSMNGRLRPRGVWVAPLIGPTRRGRKMAKPPSAARTSPISVVDEVNRSRIGGTYAATVVIDQASPKAPSPSVQMSGPAGASPAAGRRTSARRGRGAVKAPSLLGVEEGDDLPGGQVAALEPALDVPRRADGDIGTGEDKSSLAPPKRRAVLGELARPEGHPGAARPGIGPPIVAGARNDLRVREVGADRALDGFTISEIDLVRARPEADDERAPRAGAAHGGGGEGAGG